MTKPKKPPLPEGEGFRVLNDGLKVTVQVIGKNVPRGPVDEVSTTLNATDDEQDVDRRVLDLMNALADRRDLAATNLPKWLAKWR